MYGKRGAWIGATNDLMRMSDMKTIVNDKDLRHGKGLKKFAINENVDNGDDFMGKVGGKYHFIMMVGDGEVYGFEGEKIDFTPLGDHHNPIGFQWTPAKNREVDFNWLPLDDDQDWVPFEDMVGNDDEEYNDDGFDFREWM